MLHQVGSGHHLTSTKYQSLVDYFSFIFLPIFVRHGVIVLGASLGYNTIEKEARNTKLAIIISYPTSTSGITVLLKNEKWNKNKTSP